MLPLFSALDRIYRALVSLFLSKGWLLTNVQLMRFCTNNFIWNGSLIIRLPSWGACWDASAKNSCHSD